MSRFEKYFKLCNPTDKKPNDIFTRSELCKMLDLTDEIFAAKILGQNTQDVTEFNLYDRAEHVYTEALRVELGFETKNRL